MGTPVDLKAMFTRTIPTANSYRVTFEVVSASNIEPAVFVFDTEHGRFSHVAMVYDMENYPVGQALAEYNGILFYRSPYGFVEYTELSQAIYFENVTKTRLKILSDAWSRVTDVFSGTTVYDVASSTRG